MSRVKRYTLNIAITALSIFLMSGCSAMQETFASQMEVPTLENQVNRVAVGMAVVRENNIMAFKMPISADASWPSKLAKEITDSDKQYIDGALKLDPYYATMHYTKGVQRQILGSGALMSQLGDAGNIVALVADQGVSPLTYRAINKVSILYGKNPKNWPNIFGFNGSLGGFLYFKDGTLQDIDSPTGDIYETIGEALISLTPINLQKDLDRARSEMLDAYDEVASLKLDKGDIESTLNSDAANKKSKKRPNDFVPLSSSEKREMKRELAVIEQSIKESESIADEKEMIYFELLDQAVVALESDMNIDDIEYVNLAKNINIVANEIQAGAVEAYAAFGLALTNIGVSKVIQNFPNELYSLAYAKAYIPLKLQKKYNKRVSRLVSNAVYLLPNIFMGTYYASKQLSLASKYETITDTIILAYNTKTEQDRAAKEASK